MWHEDIWNLMNRHTFSASYPNQQEKLSSVLALNTLQVCNSLSLSQAMAYAARLLLHPARVNWHVQLSSPSPPAVVSRSPVLTGGWNKDNNRLLTKIGQLSGQRNLISVAKSSPKSDGIVPADDGVSLGTMKLPQNTDLQRFETLLFQVYSHTHSISLPFAFWDELIHN